VDLTLRLRGTNPRFPMFKPRPFGSYAEWNGDYENPQHTCIAGYEVHIYLVFIICRVCICDHDGQELSITALGLDTHCFPCLNGTVRARRSESKRCVPCTEANAHAPYLGMAACSCIHGYSRSLDTQACEADADSLFAPWWFVSSPVYPSVGAASFGVLAVMFSIMIVWVF
jgi:hypothetical protein